MRPDPGRDTQEALIAGMSQTQRSVIALELRDRGLKLVWQQADAAGIFDPVEQASFILRRLYPEMSEEWFRDVVAKLADMHANGKWAGFQRP
jgi:hypothetical protein